MKTVLSKEKDFLHIISLIKSAKEKALLSVNTELINLYWEVGKYISKKISNSEWGEGVIDNLAVYISKKNPEVKGFTRRGLFRMRQFYETYSNSTKVSALLTQLSWTNNLLILSKSKTIEEREFYIKLCIKERYSSRQLERQIDSGLYERTMLSKRPSLKPAKLSAKIASSFKDTYVLDFLNLPENHSEKDFRAALVLNFKKFVLEFGSNFAFVGEEYRVSVGNNDYFIDLLFYHRELRCLVAFELKIDDFKPEYIGKMNFYLEALDRDVKKKHENPSVGVILCKNKDKDVVEYTMNRNMSPSLVSEYKVKLIDKKVLRKKLDEFYQLSYKQE